MRLFAAIAALFALGAPASAAGWGDAWGLSSDSGDTGGGAGEGWRVVDGRVVGPDGGVLRCRGINWYGFEGPDRAAHGPWSGRGYGELMDAAVTQGFDCLRVPVGPEVIRGGHAPADWARRYGSDGRAVLDAFLEAAGERGLIVDLSFHSYDPGLLGAQLPGKPFGLTPSGEAYTQDDWLSDLEALAELTRGHEHVATIGLANEPHVLTWSQWEPLAIEGARAVLRGNDRLIASVGGVGGPSWSAGGYEVNWGGNLATVDPAAFDALREKVIFEVHLYPQGAQSLDWMERGVAPERVWRAQWGHLAEAGYAVVIGEVGGEFSERRDQRWAERLGRYAEDVGVESVFAWCMNPHSAWGEGLMVDNDGWSQWDEAKLSVLEDVLPQR